MSQSGTLQLAMDNNGATPQSTPPMHPELLMAACHGWHGQLTSLLNGEDHQAVPIEHRRPSNLDADASQAAVFVEIDIHRSNMMSPPLPTTTTSLLLQGVTSDGDSALHVVAAAGDDDRHLRSAMVIYSKARHLLEARNKRRSTPLHVAVRAGNVDMLALLICLAGEEEGGEDRRRALLRMENGVGETALHEAVRGDDMRAVAVLMTADPCLARVPDAGVSPLYLAVVLRRYAIVRDLHARDNQLSYAGPAGQNALHAAVLQSKGLHDSDGRTFVHVAAKKKRYSIVAYACQTPALSTILNKQDNEGNTALHLAVEVGDWWIFARLFANKQVDLNLPNNNKQTPLELAVNTIPTGLYCLLNSRILIQETLIAANATRGVFRRDANMQEYSPQSDAENEEKGSAIVSNSTQFLSVGLVLITTMAFGATFALPGGYIADDHPHGGTPTLARVKQFQGFMMANTLAFFCSSLAVLSLVFAGTPTVELPMRYMHYNISIWLSLNAVGSLAIAFAIAVYILITPVAAKTSLAVIVVILSIGILHSPSVTEKFTVLLLVLCIRPGILPLLRSSISKVMFLMCWPLIVIFGWQELSSRYR
ncbi:ankyrin repeat-containing protein At2g01680-like isoform X2 [Miscanthus floridulus]|uniref:ankyrin repeat-containing protein At2g01680-like isoform X2 n=1 Tax=Miscanthus floridulus TaxID=154761 RepID=UPI00345961DC